MPASRATTAADVTSLVRASRDASIIITACLTTPPTTSLLHVRYLIFVILRLPYSGWAKKVSRQVTYWRQRYHSYLGNGWSYQLQIWWKVSISSGQHVSPFQEIRSSRLEIEIWRISGKKVQKRIEYVLRLPKYPPLRGNRGR